MTPGQIVSNWFRSYSAYLRYAVARGDDSASLEKEFIRDIQILGKGFRIERI